ncbi:MAG: oligosaccharide flippase family protein [Sphingorhabdus sp.]
MGMEEAQKMDATTKADFGNRVKTAVFWRSGTQIIAQIISWGVTLAVLRILDPSDYGLFAMSAAVLIFLNFLNGYGFVSALIQSEKIEEIRIKQAFGMMILLNGSLALIQVLVAAPLAAAYYKEPIVADMLRWQALIFLATPFLILPEALVTRELEFKKPAIVNLLSALSGACVALVLALGGYGVWTLVFAPIAIFWTRAVGMVIATNFRYLPSFNFKGAGYIFTFGGTLLISHGFFIVQSQSDIFIAGRALDNHRLGLYAEALMITQLFATKFIPPLNEVAFPAYSRIQHDKAALSSAFLKAVRLIMLVAFPLYFGMAISAGPFVETIMGPKWVESIPLVTILALAMPFAALQFLFQPVMNGLGMPHMTMRNSIAGAVLMPSVYLFAVQYGVNGLAWGWLIAFPLLLAFTIYQAKPHVGFTLNGLFQAVLPGLSTAFLMAATVWLADRYLVLWLWHDMPAPLHLALLTMVGAALYAGLLWFVARKTFMEVVNLVVRRKPPESVTS